MRVGRTNPAIRRDGSAKKDAQLGLVRRDTAGQEARAAAAAAIILLLLYYYEYSFAFLF